MHRSAWLLLMPCLLSAPAHAAVDPSWNEPREPFKIYGDTYYVGTKGLTALLITSKAGHILMDGALPESAEQIAQNIKTLGFRVEDVKLILNSHVHFDHAGGIAELQKLSGATVAASPSSAKVLQQGHSDADDPQYGRLPPIQPVKTVKTVKDREVLRVGSLALTAVFTPGHTPGGTSWTWKSCEGSRCLQLVYADSLTPISADGFYYSRTPHHFQQSYEALKALPCDLLITPHPEASDLFKRIERNQLVDPKACWAYAELGSIWLAKRLAAEATGSQ